MSNIAEFKKHEDATPVYVNANLVRLVEPLPNGSGTRICFDHEHLVVVEGEVKEVIMALKNA